MAYVVSQLRPASTSTESLLGLFDRPRKRLRLGRRRHRLQLAHRLCHTLHKGTRHRFRCVSPTSTPKARSDAICRGITIPPILFIPYIQDETQRSSAILALWRAEQVAAGVSPRN